MTRKEVHLIYRVLVLIFLGLSLGLGIAVAVSNPELEKVIRSGWPRDILMLVGPFAALSAIGFNQINRTRHLSSLATEALIVLIGYCGFLLVALPHILRHQVPTGSACRWFSLRCVREVLVPNFWLSLPIMCFAALLVWMLYRREFRKIKAASA